MSEFTPVDAEFSYIESFTNLERGGYAPREYRLDRMKRLLDLVDHPETQYRIVHVAGSKGKGSTATFLASVLTEAGYRTGLYTSPHVITYKERITDAGREYPDELFMPAFAEIRRAVEILGRSGDPALNMPTTFELLTALAFLVFRERRCEWVVLETGLGGRLDATNVVTPRASILTPIELEHTEYLGNTVTSIAQEKAGIIKPGVPAFSSSQKPEVREVFEKAARDRGTTCTFLPDRLKSLTVNTTASGSKLSLSWVDGSTLQTDLQVNGRMQADNAALSALAATALLPGLPVESVARGLSRAWLPGRNELVPGTPPLLLDGAHTPASVGHLAATVQELFPKGVVLIFGSIAGKDAASMAGILSPLCRKVIVSRPGTFKPSDPEAVQELFLTHTKEVELHAKPSDALRAARQYAGDRFPIVVSGSFYMVSEIRKLVLAERFPHRQSGGHGQNTFV